MCLFTQFQNKCCHSQCRIIQTIRDLNANIVNKFSSYPQNKLPSLSTLPRSERVLPYLTEARQRNQSQQNPVLNRSLSEHIIDGGMCQDDMRQNPENEFEEKTNSGEIIKLRRQVNELNIKLNIILKVLNENGIIINLPDELLKQQDMGQQIDNV